MIILDINNDRGIKDNNLLWHLRFLYNLFISNQ